MSIEKFKEIREFANQKDIRLIFFAGQIRTGSIATLTMLGNSPTINDVVYHPFMHETTDTPAVDAINQKIASSLYGATVLIKEHVALIEDEDIKNLCEIADDIVVNSRNFYKQLNSVCTNILEATYSWMKFTHIFNQLRILLSRLVRRENASNTNSHALLMDIKK